MELLSRKLGWVAGGLLLIVGAVLYWRVPIFRSAQDATKASPAPAIIQPKNEPVRQGDAKAASKPQITWEQVSSFRLDWDRYKDVQITLESPASWNDAWGDPPISDFQRIRILVPGKKEFVIEGDWDGGLTELKA